MLSTLKKYSLLYVEDDPTARTNLSEYLESFFSKIYLAKDGIEALQLYKKVRPQILLIDINIPYINGLDVAKEIRKIDDDVKILILTAHIDKEKLLQAIELNLTKYLTKPLSTSKLKDVLTQLDKELLTLSPRYIFLSENSYFDKKDRVLFKDGIEVDLSSKEKVLLELLVKNRGSCISNETIMSVVWEEHFDKEISQDSVKRQISYLRRKLPAKIITNVYGKGYLLK